MKVFIAEYFAIILRGAMYISRKTDYNSFNINELDGE